MKYLVCCLLLFSISGCQTPRTNHNVNTVAFTTNPEPPPYARSLRKYSRTTTVFSNYETLYMLNVTAFSTEFYEAFEKTQNERFLAMNMLKGLKKNACFFVSIYSPNEEYNNLTNSHLWEFVLNVGANKYSSISIKKVANKDAWYPFFPYINRWSSDYIISFEVPNSDEIKPPMTLSLGTSQVKTVMEWQE